MKKLYEANVAFDMVDYFEKNAIQRGVKIVSRDLRFDSDWNPVYQYVLEAEEGIIDPKWEIAGVEV